MDEILTLHTSWKVSEKFSALNYRIAISKRLTLSDSLTRGEGGCFVGESSLKSRSAGLTVAVVFQYKFAETTANTIWKETNTW